MDKADLTRRMDGALTSLKDDYQGLRTGRANINLLEPVTVEAYGSSMPINQVGAISAPDPRMLMVSVWDKGLVVAVEKAIRNAGLGLNPVVDGQAVRVPLPPLNEERRRELAKMAGKYAENARVAIRNIRRDGNEGLKKEEKDGEISQDEMKRLQGEVQTLTDNYVTKVDDLLKAKEEEIMQV